MLLKAFFQLILTDFVNLILSAQVGKKLFNNKVEIVKLDETGTTVRLNLGSKAKYKMTIKKM